MNKIPKFLSVSAALAVCAGLFSFAVNCQGQGAVATISGVAVTGGYDYTILLTDSGTTSLNSFWYGWTSTGNNLPSTPSTLGNNLGWGQSVFGAHSIEWVNSTGTTLTPGQTGTFTFFSPDSPTTITTAPVGGSVAYVNGIDFSQGVAGDSTGAFYPTLVAAPEPSGMGLLGLGAAGLLAAGWMRVRMQQ